MTGQIVTRKTFSSRVDIVKKLIIIIIIDRHLFMYTKRTRLHRTLSISICTDFGYRNTPALYPHLGVFHLSAATCSRYSDRTFQLARSCAFGPHKRLRIPRADSEVLGQANRGATSSSIVRVCSLGLSATENQEVSIIVELEFSELNSAVADIESRIRLWLS